jgi:hypothetical protein
MNSLLSANSGHFPIKSAVFGPSIGGYRWSNLVWTSGHPTNGTHFQKMAKIVRIFRTRKALFHSLILAFHGWPARGRWPDARRPTPDARRPTPDARRPTPDARPMTTTKNSPANPYKMARKRPSIREAINHGFLWTKRPANAYLYREVSTTTKNSSTNPPKMARKRPSIREAINHDEEFARESVQNALQTHIYIVTVNRAKHAARLVSG